MDILYMDEDIIVCIKPHRILSTDEPGGVPDLMRRELSDEHADIRTVHRLDRVVGGVMVLARNANAASELSRQIREGTFQKEYLAVVHGRLEEGGSFTDLLYRDKARKMTFVTHESGKGVQEALLHYEVLKRVQAMSLVQIQLVTGRTHQIRVQFSSRGYPIVGERKYATPLDDCELALWSYKVAFQHPKIGEHMIFFKEPPKLDPWSSFY